MSVRPMLARLTASAVVRAAVFATAQAVTVGCGGGSRWMPMIDQAAAARSDDPDLFRRQFVKCRDGRDKYNLEYLHPKMSNGKEARYNCESVLEATVRAIKIKFNDHPEKMTLQDVQDLVPSARHYSEEGLLRGMQSNPRIPAHVRALARVEVEKIEHLNAERERADNLRRQAERAEYDKKEAEAEAHRKLVLAQYPDSHPMFNWHTLVVCPNGFTVESKVMEYNARGVYEGNVKVGLKGTAVAICRSNERVHMPSNDNPNVIVVDYQRREFVYPNVTAPLGVKLASR